MQEAGTAWGQRGWLGMVGEEDIGVLSPAIVVVLCCQRGSL